MILTLERKEITPTYTIGKLYINGAAICDTLEDPVRDLNKNGVFDNGEKKEYGNTAIPYGTYTIKLVNSPKYGTVMPRLMNVNSFEGILMHPGNTTKDTLGCILLGKSTGKGTLINSRISFNEVFEILKKTAKLGESITITIK